MTWQMLKAHTRIAQPSRRWRRIGTALLIGLALTIAACGAPTGVGAPPTPTPKPTATATATATATPVPCASWRIVASPNGNYSMSELAAVSALSSASAWAVGVTYNSGAYTTGPSNSLIEQWDGSAWHIVANPGHGDLNAVAAISPTDVWAVGTQSEPKRPLILHWNGTTWSVVPSVFPTGIWSAWLSDVVAITSQDVWAFGGQYATPPDQQPPELLVEHWNGARWQIVSSPPLPPSPAPQNGASLSATRIPGTNQLWAVGEWHAWVSMGRGEPLIERWDGTAWQIVPSPALPTGAMGGGWSGVVALSATNAWAVGSYAVKNPMDSHPLIAHWDGTRWQIVVADPNTYGELDSVAAASANDVRAAGTLLTGSGASSGNGRRIPLIEQWNGTAWQVQATPEPPSGAINESLSIATDSAGNYWAVGSYYNAAYLYRTLTLHCP